MMRAFYLSLPVLLLCGTALAQSVPVFTGPDGVTPARVGEPIKLQEMRAALQAKADSFRLDMEIAARLASQAAVTPTSFLAAGQTDAGLRAGAFDATPAILAAAAVGDPVLLPCGAYRVDTPWLASSGTFDVRGVSKGCVILNVTFPTGDIIDVVSGSVNRPRLTDVTINAAVQRTGGNAIHLDRTYDATLADLVFTGPHAGDAIQVDNASTTHLDRIDCRPPTYKMVNGALTIVVESGTFGAGACIHGTGAVGTDGFVELYGKEINSFSWHYGLHLDNGSGATITSGDFILSSQAIMIDPPAGAKLWAVYMTNVQADSSTFDNIHIEGQGQVTDLMFTGMWISNSQLGVGLAINNPNLNGFQMTNSNVLYNYQHGTLLAAGKNITITGSHFMQNSTQKNGGFAGLAIAPTPSAMLDQITIEGNHFGYGGIAQARGNAPTQANGLFVGPPSGTQSDPDPRQLTIVNNQAFGNTVAGFYLTAGPKVVATGNTQ